MACAGTLARFSFAPSPALAQAAFERLDEAGRARFADMALALARQAGASYADLRIGRTRWQGLTARDGRLDRNEGGRSVGFGLRLLIDGAWGFAADPLLEEESLRRAVQNAAGNAAAARLLGAVPVELESLQAHQDKWSMPMRIDPFAVPDKEKIDLLLSVTEAARKSGAAFCNAWVDMVEEEKYFASSIGSRIQQTRHRIAPGFSVTAIDRGSGRFASRASMAPPRGAGWEHVLEAELAREAADAAPEAREKLAAKSVQPGRYDLVIDASNLWLTLHETVGHSTELDRALGWEADYAGTSFVRPEARGRLQYGSPLMSVLADRTQPGGLASVAYDDDGVQSAGREFAIIRDGVFENFQMAIGQARLIGERQSNGCAYAERPSAFPLQRMPNISLQPNPRPSSLEDLIGGVDDGILILGNGSWSIDQQRYNFQFGGQLFYEIKNGRRGAMLRDVAYQAETRQFWNAMDGLGDRTTFYFGGTFNCGKGQPGQSAPVSHGAVPGRFRRIDVLNTERNIL